MLRLVIITVMFASALAFDLCHDTQSIQIDKTTQNTADHSLDAGQVYFFNPINSFKLSDGNDKLITRILFDANQDKFLAEYHNHRIFHSLKEESVNRFVPFHLLAHLIKLSTVDYSSPDDYHPLA